MFEKQAAQAMEKVLKCKEFPAKILVQWLEVPPKPELGHLAFPCHKLAPVLKKAPHQIAQDLVSAIKKEKWMCEAKALGPYVNFYFEPKSMAEETLNRIFKETKKYGTLALGKGKRAVIEFASPNTNKPLTLGHLRNMALGESISRIHETGSFKVARVQVINDRGVHICKSMLAYQKWSQGETPQSARMKGDHLVGKYYVMFQQHAHQDPSLEEEAKRCLEKWEQNEKETRALWKKMNEWVLKGFDETYHSFGTVFDKNYYESQYYDKGKQIVLDGVKKGLFTRKEDGSVAVQLEKMDEKEKVLLRKEGTTVYTVQDIYLAIQRYKDYKFDTMIYVVANEQNHHFQQLFAILELLKQPFAGKLHHLSYGLVLLPEGKMKSREGKVVDADDTIHEMHHLARAELLKRHGQMNAKELKKRANAIGLGALKFYLLKNDMVKDMFFDPAQSISFEGETGPYVQYTYARAKSILRKAKSLKPRRADFSLLVQAKEQNLIALLSQYSFHVEQSLKALSPHKVAHYLLALANAFNSYYHEFQVIQEDPAQKKLQDARLALVHATTQTLSNGLTLLGIEALEEM